MSSYNRVILMGNLTRDVELRYTPKQTAVTDIGLAVNDHRKNERGEWVQETTFVEVTLWGRTAEVASEYTEKGSPLLIEGRLKQETWNQDGKKRSRMKVVGERLVLLANGNRSIENETEEEEEQEAPPKQTQRRSKPAAKRKPVSAGSSHEAPADTPF